MGVWDPEVQKRLEREFLVANLWEGFSRNYLVEDQLELHHPKEREMRPKMSRRQVAVNHWEIWERHQPVLDQSLEQKGRSALASSLALEYPEGVYSLLEASVEGRLKLDH